MLKLLLVCQIDLFSIFFSIFCLVTHNTTDFYITIKFYMSLLLCSILPNHTLLIRFSQSLKTHVGEKSITNWLLKKLLCSTGWIAITPLLYYLLCQGNHRHKRVCMWSQLTNYIYKLYVIKNNCCTAKNGGFKEIIFHFGWLLCRHFFLQLLHIRLFSCHEVLCQSLLID